MYAVGRRHPLQREARAFFSDSIERQERLVTSAEVLQELLHAYLPVGRHDALDAAMTLIEGIAAEAWTIEPADVVHARRLVDELPHLGARDLLHVASCRRRGVSRVQTYDRALSAAFPNAPA